MGDLAKMHPLEELDGTKRMIRWDMLAASTFEDLMATRGVEVNTLQGFEIETMKASHLAALVYAMLAAADFAMKLEDPRLSYRQVQSALDPGNIGAVLGECAACIAANMPESEEAPAEDTEGKEVPATV